MGVKVRFIILNLAMAFVVSCAPVKFSSEKEKSSVFELYLMGQYNREYMVAWIFSDAEGFRARIFDIKTQIASYAFIEPHFQDRIIDLENDLNFIIQKFNDKNLFVRTYQVAASGLEKYFRDGDYAISVSPTYLRQEGMSPITLSDSVHGVVNSVIKNGFTMEEVDLLCRSTCSLSDYRY